MERDFPISAKRPRQSTACNWCRSHKLKCDAEQPSCQNCRKRGIPCVTTNLRRPELEGCRQEPLGRHKKKRRSSSRPHPTPVRRSSRESSSPSIFAIPFEQFPQHEEDRAKRNNVTLVTDRSRSLRQVIGSGSSLYTLAQWLDLFFANQANWQPIFPYFQQGLAYSMEVPLSPGVSLPELPSISQAQEYAAEFFSRVHPIFPIIVESEFAESVEHLRAASASTLQSKDYPALALAYAVFSASADEAEGRITPTGTRFLEGAYILFAHIVAIPYLTSVQALLMLTIVLRNRNKDGASWSILGQTIRMAQSIGLHRNVSTSPEAADLHARIWWTAYILERIMQLETGRPSAIRDKECDQILPVARDSDIYFLGLIGLAKIQTRVIDLLYDTTGNQRPIKQMLLDMGRTDRALLDWADDFPESIRPGRDLMCTSNKLHFATYLTLHYQQTMIALHRPALMSELYWLKGRIRELCAGTQWGDRLEYSLCIGAASARAILKSLNDLLLYSRMSRVITANQTLLAILVLGIYITKIPESLMNDSDLAMLGTFAQKMEKEYLEMGQDTEFARGLSVFLQQLSEQVALAKPGGRHTAALQPDFDMGTLDDTWPLLWSEDWTNYFSNSDDNMLQMYLLGLPQSDGL